MTEREEQAVIVLNTLYNNPLLSDIHRLALEVGIIAIKALPQEPCIQEKQANADNIDAVYIDGFKAGYSQARFDLEQEPCDDVCEWFEQYVDIATDIVELRFSDGTVKRAKRGLYMRDIEKSIRKMLIDQIANEKKQEPKWIPVSERLPDNHGDYISSDSDGVVGVLYFIDGEWIYDVYDEHDIIDNVIAWMPLPEPYKASPTGAEEG